jgi:hypothetical protein
MRRLGDFESFRGRFRHGLGEFEHEVRQRTEVWKGKSMLGSGFIFYSVLLWFGLRCILEFRFLIADSVKTRRDAAGTRRPEAYAT